jgi:hypothetical protein
MSSFNHYLALAIVYTIYALLLLIDGHAAHAFCASAAAGIYAAQGRHPPSH